MQETLDQARDIDNGSVVHHVETPAVHIKKVRKEECQVLVPPARIELATPPLPRVCSTPELRRHRERAKALGQARGTCHRWSGLARTECRGFGRSLRRPSRPKVVTPLVVARPVAQGLWKRSRGGGRPNGS